MKEVKTKIVYFFFVVYSHLIFNIDVSILVDVLPLLVIMKSSPKNLLNQKVNTKDHQIAIKIGINQKDKKLKNFKKLRDSLLKMPSTYVEDQVLAVPKQLILLGAIERIKVVIRPLQKPNHASKPIIHRITTQIHILNRDAVHLDTNPKHPRNHLHVSLNA